MNRREPNHQPQRQPNHRRQVQRNLRRQVQWNHRREHQRNHQHRHRLQNQNQRHMVRKFFIFPFPFGWWWRGGGGWCESGNFIFPGPFGMRKLDISWLGSASGGVGRVNRGCRSIEYFLHSLAYSKRDKTHFFLFFPKSFTTVYVVA